MRFQPVLVALAALAVAATAWAQNAKRATTTPPANDSFAGAQWLAGLSWAVASDNRAASRERDEPRIAGHAGGHSLWYRWQAPASRRYHLSAWSASNEVNTMLGLYTGPTLAALREVASATGFRQRSASLSDAAVSFDAVAGTTYYIAVDSQTTAAGTFVLSLIDSEWEFLGLGSGFVTPAVGPDGTLYTAESIGFLYAIHPDGSQKWRFAMSGVVVLGGPALGPDGTVYIGDDANILYAIDAATGNPRWQTQLSGEILSSPAVAADGTIYIRCENGRLYALAPNGVVKWSVELPASALSLASPIIAPDGTVYCGAADGRLYAVSASGVKKWEFDTGASIYGTPAIGTDGTIYLGSASKRFFALSPDGIPLWAVTLPDEIGGSPAIGLDGTIYFGCGDGRLYAIAPEGTVRWSYATGAEIILGAPAIASDGTIYIGSDDSLVHAVNPDGTRQRIFATGDYIAASPLLHRGALYIPSFDYRLYAIDVGHVPASSVWPMDRQNPARTAHIETPALEIGVPPRAQTVPLGGVAVFTVGATGQRPLSYQWYYDGTAIGGATSASYRIENVLLAHAGHYSVRVSDATRSLLSPAAALQVSGNTAGDAHLFSFSTRAVVGPNTDILVPGIIVSGPEPKQFLIRAVGPGLGEFGVMNPLERPNLRLLRGGTELASNTGWDVAGAGPMMSAAFDQVGAFALAPGSADCALLVTLAPGNYTAQLSALHGASGAALVEVYELATTPTKLISFSSRALVGTGRDALISGLTVTGTGAKQFLIRAAGPALASFGLGGKVLARPRLELFGGSHKIAENAGWSSAPNAVRIDEAASEIGAFYFNPGSADSALLVTLAPGSYTLQVSGVDDTTGIALLEVYEVP